MFFLFLNLKPKFRLNIHQKNIYIWVGGGKMLKKTSDFKEQFGRGKQKRDGFSVTY